MRMPRGSGVFFYIGMKLITGQKSINSGPWNVFHLFVIRYNLFSE